MSRASRGLFALLPALLAILAPFSATASSITGYTPVSVACRDAAGNQLLAIRSFTRDNHPSYLAVDPQTLATRVVPAAEIVVLNERPARTRLADAVARTTAPPYLLQNHGLRHALGEPEGVVLTVDLCPSRRPFEKGMFEALAKSGRTSKKPVPVALCITGAWLASHPDEVGWLKEQERSGALGITWVNHSLSHFYDPALPLARNFMLADVASQRSEILANEVRMLEAGLTPSPFFRFPGLVADERLVKLLAELSLIPLGADAWLAKGEEPKPGSIILVHGNGNEPPGIARLMKLLQEKSLPLLLPLTASLPPMI